MQVSPPNRANPEGSVLYRSGLNPKIQRNFEVFTPCDFIAAITQHIPDKSFQLVRYYGWSSNKMRGQRDKRAAEEANNEEGQAVQLIDEREVVERILRHLGLWEQGVRVHTGADPPPECTIEPWLDDPFPDYDTEPVPIYANN